MITNKNLLKKSCYIKFLIIFVQYKQPKGAYIPPYWGIYEEERCLYKQVGSNRKEANDGSGIQKSSTDSIFWLKNPG